MAAILMAFPPSLGDIRFRVHSEFWVHSGVVESQKRFRFLTDEEYASLPPAERGPYLQAASAELERRQKQIRELVRQMVKENPAK
jgi:hypothetical protein